MSFSSHTRGQVSLELITTLGFILLIFLIVVILALERNYMANNLKVFLDARSITHRLAMNVNTISEQSEGYFRYMSFPLAMYGGVEYNLSAHGNVISILYRDSEWATQVIASNVTIFCLDKGETVMNRIENTGDSVVVTCNKSNLGFRQDSFRASSSQAGENANISVIVWDRSHVAPLTFNVLFNGSVNHTLSDFPAGGKERIFFSITVPSAGTHILTFEADSEGEVEESIEGDNYLNVSWRTE